MNLKKVWLLIAFILLTLLVFILGIMVGQRNIFNASDNKLEVVGPNLNIKNSLSEISSRDIYFPSIDTQGVIAGKMLFKIVNQKTEILIKIDSSPLTVKGKNAVQNIPKSLEVKTASRIDGGKDYQYTSIGFINFDEPKNNVLTATFSTILDYPLGVPSNDTNKGIDERIVITGKSNEEKQSVFQNNDPNLPLKVRGDLSPYYWIII